MKTRLLLGLLVAFGGLLPAVVLTAQDQAPGGSPGADAGQERATPGHPEGDVPQAEAIRLKQAVLRNQSVAAELQAAGEWELLRANVVDASIEKFSACANQQCASLEFVLWSSGETLTATVDRTTTALVLEPVRGGRALLTDSLRRAAIGIAEADPLVREAAGEGPRGGPGATDWSAPGVCERSLCAKFGVTGEQGTVGVEVTLRLQRVIYVVSDGRVVRDER